GGAHEAVERLGVGSDLGRHLFRRLRGRLDEGGDTESGETRDSGRDENAVHELEYADVRGQSLGLWHHLSVHLDFGFRNFKLRKYTFIPSKTLPALPNSAP